MANIMDYQNKKVWKNGPHGPGGWWITTVVEVPGLENRELGEGSDLGWSTLWWRQLSSARSTEGGVFWVVVLKNFYFHPYLGKIPILTNIFRMGWNHQLVLVCGGFGMSGFTLQTGTDTYPTKR